MDLFALPRDVCDIIWAKSRVMLRAERARITTYYVKEVLREYREYMVEHEEKYAVNYMAEVDGEHITNGISLSKCYNSYPYCSCDLEIIGNTCTLYFDEDYTYYKLEGFKACEVFNNGNVNDYFKKEFRV